MAYMLYGIGTYLMKINIINKVMKFIGGISYEAFFDTSCYNLPVYKVCIARCICPDKSSIINSNFNGGPVFRLLF